MTTTILTVRQRTQVLEAIGVGFLVAMGWFVGLEALRMLDEGWST